MNSRSSILSFGLVVSIVMLTITSTSTRISSAATVPSGFTDSVVAGGLTNPTAMALAPDGCSLPFADFASPSEPVEADGSFVTSKATYSYGTHAAHVAVDPATGHVDVVDYVGVADVGRMINPLIVHGQKIGAIVQGLGGVFLEHLVYDDQAQLLTGSLADYFVPTATNFANVRAVSLEHRTAPDNPLGVKGAGEDGIIPVGAVIANAVAAALSSLGCEITVLPLSPPRLWRIINAARR